MNTKQVHKNNHPILNYNFTNNNSNLHSISNIKDNMTTYEFLSNLNQKIMTKNNTNNSVNKFSRILTPVDSSNYNNSNFFNQFMPNKYSKSDLKQYLVFSDNNQILKAKNNIDKKFDFNFNDKLDSNDRVNSESSLYNYFSLNESNKLYVIEIMKYLRYQFSSLDHQKLALEKITKSKSKNFCLLISEESNSKKVHVSLFLLKI